MSVLEIQGPDSAWKPFYHLYDFTLAVRTYRDDPVFAALTFHEYQAKSSIEWAETKGSNVRKEHRPTPEQQRWLGEAAAKLRPAAVAYCAWLTAKAVHDKDARSAMAAVLLWERVEFLDRSEAGNAAEKLTRFVGFISAPERAKAVDLIRSEMRGQNRADPQWQISKLTTSWSSAYSKSYGLSTLRISPPEGKQFLHVRAQVRNIGKPVVDPSSLPMYQSSPRDFRDDTALDWWNEKTDSSLDVPEKTLPARRLLTVDMVNLIGHDLPGTSDSWPLKQLIPCHVVGDACPVLRGPMADTLMFFLAMTNTAANPTLVSTGSWVGQGTEFTIEAYFAVTKTPTINYSLYLMGSKPAKLPQPEDT